jgi:inorganic pyrophosphatase
MALWRSKLIQASCILGDNDPVDACDISSIQHHTGDVIVAKVLGTYAMIDEGETDWKILVIDVNDPLAEHINGAFRFSCSLTILVSRAKYLF